MFIVGLGVGVVGGSAVVVEHLAGLSNAWQSQRIALLKTSKNAKPFQLIQSLPKKLNKN